MYSFVIYNKNKRRVTWNCKASNESEAWEKVYNKFPDTEYIDLI